MHDMIKAGDWMGVFLCSISPTPSPHPTPIHRHQSNYCPFVACLLFLGTKGFHLSSAGLELATAADDKRPVLPSAGITEQGATFSLMDTGAWPVMRAG